ATIQAKGATITARDYTFDTSGLKAGDNDIVFRNTGPAQIHHVAVLGFAPGVNEAAALGAFQTFASLGPDAQPPPGTPEPELLAQPGLPRLAVTGEAGLQPDPHRLVGRRTEAPAEAVDVEPQAGLAHLRLQPGVGQPGQPVGQVDEAGQRGSRLEKGTGTL